MYLRNSSNSVCPLQSACQHLKKILLKQPEQSQQVKCLLSSISQLDHNSVNTQSCTQFFEIYQNLFKKTPMGLEMLKALLSVAKKLHQPITVRIIYEYSFELQPLKHNMLEIQNWLIKGFQINLSFRKKLPIGFKCGIRALKFIKDFESFQKLLQKIIVYLKAETSEGYLKQYQGKSLAKVYNSKSDKNSHIMKKQSLKKKVNQFTKTKDFTIRTKAQRLPFLLLLYRTYFIGGITSEIGLKKDYFIELCDQLFNRLLREYPGRFIKESVQEIQLTQKTYKHQYQAAYQHQYYKSNDQNQKKFVLTNQIESRTKSFSIKNRGQSLITNKGPSKSIITKNYFQINFNENSNAKNLDRAYNPVLQSPYLQRKKVSQAKHKVITKKQGNTLRNNQNFKQYNSSYEEQLQNSQNLGSEQMNSQSISRNALQEKSNNTLQNSQLLQKSQQKSMLKSSNQKSTKLNYFHNQQIQFNYSSFEIDKQKIMSVRKQFNQSQQSVLASKITKKNYKDYSIQSCSPSFKSKIIKINQSDNNQNKENLNKEPTIKKLKQKRTQRIMIEKITKDYLEDLYQMVVIQDQTQEESSDQQFYKSKNSIQQQCVQQDKSLAKQSQAHESEKMVKRQYVQSSKSKVSQSCLKNNHEFQDQQIKQKYQQKQFQIKKQSLSQLIMKDKQYLKQLIKIQLFFKRILAQRKLLSLKNTTTMNIQTIVKQFEHEQGKIRKFVLSKVSKIDDEYKIFAQQFKSPNSLKLSEILDDSDSFIKLNLHLLKINFETLRIQIIQEVEEKTLNNSVKEIFNNQCQQFVITVSNTRQNSQKQFSKVFKTLTNQSISDINTVRTSNIVNDDESSINSIRELQQTQKQAQKIDVITNTLNNVSKSETNPNIPSTLDQNMANSQNNTDDKNAQTCLQSIDFQRFCNKLVQNEIKIDGLIQIVEENQQQKQQKCSLKEIIENQNDNHEKVQMVSSTHLSKNIKSVKICSKIQQFDITDFQFTINHEFTPHVLVTSNSITMILTDPKNKQQEQVIYFFKNSSAYRLRQNLQERVIKCLNEAIKEAGSHDLSDVIKCLKKQILQCKQVELNSVLTFGIEDTVYVIRFSHDQKNKYIIADAGNGIQKIKILLTEEQKMNQVISVLMSKQISIKGQNNLCPEIVIPNIWVIIQQTSIIINDLKKQLKIKCILQEKIKKDLDKQNSIDVRIKIKDSSNHLEVNNINRKLRNKIKKNLSTLIGYYLKIENGEPILQCNSEKIQRFLQLL